MKRPRNRDLATRIGEKLFRLALLAYPLFFRERFGEDLWTAHRDWTRATQPSRRLHAWARSLVRVTF